MVCILIIFIFGLQFWSRDKKCIPLRAASYWFIFYNFKFVKWLLYAKYSASTACTVYIILVVKMWFHESGVDINFKYIYTKNEHVIKHCDE